MRRFESVIFRFSAFARRRSNCLISSLLVIACFMAALLALSLQVQAGNKKPSKPDSPPKYGSLLLFEPASGQILYHHNADRLIYPASLTKLMTAYLTFEAIKQGHLSLQSKLIISDYAREQPPTRVGMKKGIEVSIDFAVRALIIRSANDFAVALAETISGSEAVFIERMNETARRLGMLHTNFVNPHGLPNASQVTTARDLAMLTSTIIREYPQYADVFSNEEVRFRNLTLHSHNSLLHTYQGADGMKTGFTCASGYNIIVSATRNGHRLVVVVIGALTSYERTRHATSLLNKGFKILEGTSKPEAKTSLASLPIEGNTSSDTLDLSHKTRTWVCGNGPKPRRARKRRKGKKSARRSKRKKSARKKAKRKKKRKKK